MISALGEFYQGCISGRRIRGSQCTAIALAALLSAAFDIVFGFTLADLQGGVNPPPLGESTKGFFFQY